MKSAIFIMALAIVLIGAGTAMAQQAGTFGAAAKVGVDFAGSWRSSVIYGSNRLDTDTSASLCAEGYYHVSEYLDAGAGIQYLFEREIDTSPGAKFWFLPVYGVVRLHPAMTDYTPYGIAQLGYAYHDGNDVYTMGATDTKGGLYWGAGLGFIFKRHFLAELLYSESRGAVESSSIDIDITHRRVTFSVGYNF